MMGGSCGLVVNVCDLLVTEASGSFPFFPLAGPLTQLEEVQSQCGKKQQQAQEQ
jgi:hypothetical protein